MRIIIVAVYENDNLMIPKPEMVLKKDMKISILVKTKYAQKVMKRFTNCKYNINNSEDEYLDVINNTKIKRRNKFPIPLHWFYMHFFRASNVVTYCCCLYLW